MIRKWNKTKVHPFYPRNSFKHSLQKTQQLNQNVKPKKGTRFRRYYCQNSKTTTKRMTCKPNVYIQRHTTIRILPAIIKYSTNNNDTQTWENSLDVLSYQPISLLLTISKVLENIILKNKQIKLEPTRLDPKPTTCVPTGSIHRAKMQPHNRCHL